MKKRGCSSSAKPTSTLLTGFCNVLLVLVTANVTSDDPEERAFLNVVREQQSLALLHQGRQAETGHDDQAEALDLTGKRCGLTIPEQGDQSRSGDSNQQVW